MKAAINALQDHGYVVKTANADLGMLQATKDIDKLATSQGRKEAAASVIFGGIIGAPRAVYAQNIVLECSVNVSEFGAKTRVRVNFTKKTFDNNGAVILAKDIDDSQYYQDFFAKMDEAMSSNAPKKSLTAKRE